MKKIYGASDYHFDHNNVIKYDNRPYSNVNEMNEDIITKHNEIVKPGDDFYYLGDLCFGKDPESHLKRLNGNKFFIKGNHDSPNVVKLYKKYGTYLGEQASFIKIGNTKVVFNHFRMLVWDQSHRGSIHFYGHSHGALSHLDKRCQDLFIGSNNYYPWDLEERINILSLQDKNLQEMI